MFYLLSVLWFLRQIKATLFWLYLWQLKEYHLGRFLDHFRTAKGKKALANPVLIFKIFLFFYALILSFFNKLLIWQLFAVWIIILIVLYFFESLKLFQDIIKKKLKKPVLTQKTIILILSSFLVEALFLFALLTYLKNFYWFSFWLLSFDIFTLLFVSIVIFFFQLPTVMIRNRIIKKAQQKRERLKNLVVIAITGSYGKTSTKEMLATILSEKATLRGGVAFASKVLKTQEHQNSEIGIAQCILNDLKPEHEIFVCEIGAYNKGKIKEVCRFLRPKIGILTGINEQHMATFGSQENIIAAKYELIESLPENGLAIFNGEDKYCLNLYQKTKAPKKLCGRESADKFDLWAENIKTEKEYVSFKAISRDKKSATFKINLLGGHNIENILIAAAAAKELGMTLRQISLSCKKINPEQGGMKFLKNELPRPSAGRRRGGVSPTASGRVLSALSSPRRNKKGLNIIDSSYSANPSGVIADLDYLETLEGGPEGKPMFSHGARKIIVMPCLIELGKSSAEVHERIGRKIGEVCDLAIITTKDKFKEIKKGAAEKGMEGKNILFLESPKEIFAKLKDFYKEGDAILLEGRATNELINYLS